MKRPGPKVWREPPAPIRRFERERASQALWERNAGHPPTIQDNMLDIVNRPALTGPSDLAQVSVGNRFHTALPRLDTTGNLSELPMVLLVGKAVIREEHRAPALALSLEHVNRSQAQGQCIDHAVYQDLDDHRRLVFLGQWFDRDALLAHLRLPESIVFALALEGFAAEEPRMVIFDVTQDSAA